MLFFSSADIIPSVLFSSSSAFIVIFFPDITAWVVLASLSILFTNGVTGYSAEPAVISPCSVYFFCLTVSFSSLNIYETFPFPPYVLRKYSNTASLSSVLPEFVSLGLNTHPLYTSAALLNLIPFHVSQYTLYFDRSFVSPTFSIFRPVSFTSPPPLIFPTVLSILSAVSVISFCDSISAPAFSMLPLISASIFCVAYIVFPLPFFKFLPLNFSSFPAIRSLFSISSAVVNVPFPVSIFLLFSRLNEFVARSLAFILLLFIILLSAFIVPLSTDSSLLFMKLLLFTVRLFDSICPLFSMFPVVFNVRFSVSVFPLFTMVFELSAALFAVIVPLFTVS